MRRSTVRLALAGLLVVLAGCTSEDEGASSGAAPAAAASPAKAELKLEDVKTGEGPAIGPGQTAVVHYTGWLTDGTKFDSSRDRGQPFEFRLGAGDVIRGWDEGVAGMKVGGQRKLTIPPHLGYGDRAVGPIPAGSTLLFDVELVGIKD